MTRQKFFEAFLNNVGPLSKSFEEEACYREGVKNTLILLGKDVILKELTKLELFADSQGLRSHERTLLDNKSISLNFVKTYSRVKNV